MSNRNGFLACAAAVLAMSLAPSFGGAQETQTAKAAMKDQQGNDVGTVTLQDTPNGLVVTAELTGVPEGEHGFHIHAVGQCEPPFEAAGGHFNPDDKQHGISNEQGKHAGDLPNLYVPASGELKVDHFAIGMTLDDLFDGDGSAVLVHANADDYETDPTGNAGDRIACGVVER